MGAEGRGGAGEIAGLRGAGGAAAIEPEAAARIALGEGAWLGLRWGGPAGLGWRAAAGGRGPVCAAAVRKENPHPAIPTRIAAQI